MRILQLLGETRASVAARLYGFQLAKTFNAALVGLAGVDLSYIETPTVGGIGVSAAKAYLEEHLKKQAADARLRLHEIYQEECRAQSVPFTWLSFDGDPIEALLKGVETCDLVVTGHDTAYRGNVRESLSDMLAKLLSATPRPVIVCGDDAVAGADALIAYDGSLPAMRAVQLFALLGFGKGRRIHLTAIEADKELAERRLLGVAGYLRDHGYEVETIPIATTLHPADVLRIEVADRKIGTLTLGAYGHRGWRQTLFGSTTRRLMENPPCALFAYH
jgi:nucleotide-binding universal stress UspA family protein